MTAPMSVPTIGSTGWGTAVNNNWAAINAVFSQLSSGGAIFQTGASITPNVLSTSTLTGALVVGNGTAATSIGLGGGVLNAGSFVTATYFQANQTDNTDGSSSQFLRNAFTLTAQPTVDTSNAYIGTYLSVVGVGDGVSKHFKTTGNIQNIVALSEFTNGTGPGSGDVHLPDAYGVVVNMQIQNKATSTGSGGTVYVDNAYGVLITPQLINQNFGGTQFTNYYGLYLNGIESSGTGSNTIGSNYYAIYQQDSAAINYFAGLVTANAGTESTTATSGALQIVGGAGISKRLCAGGGIADASMVSGSWLSLGSQTIGNNTLTTVNTNTATIGSYTITMPASPASGQIEIIASAGIVSAFTVSANSGQTIKNAPSTIAANTAMAWIYSGTTWYRLW